MATALGVDPRADSKNGEDLMSQTMTVRRLRELLVSFDDDAVVVVSTGIGYEEPKIRLAKVRSVLVPQRYVHEPEGETVVALVGVNG